jgi:hypothetical protein
MKPKLLDMFPRSQAPQLGECIHKPKQNPKQKIKLTPNQ